jgi:lipoprotein-anchoring transpeptidase ErfK/SrfK
MGQPKIRRRSTAQPHGSKTHSHRIAIIAVAAAFAVVLLGLSGLYYASAAPAALPKKTLAADHEKFQGNTPPTDTSRANPSPFNQDAKPAPKKPKLPAPTATPVHKVAPTHTVPNAPKPAPMTKKSGTRCGSTAGRKVIVSIKARHLWACQKHKQVYSSAVVTGMENLAADRTPTGTYHIYGKQTNLPLKGCDSTGCWNDHVSYWMPFLSNQYGVYGLHDATWRKSSAFGHVSPYSKDASHGCVELPLATAAWLYKWAPIGTTLVIEQ